MPSRTSLEQETAVIEQIESEYDSRKSVEAESHIWRIPPNVHTVSCELNGFAPPDPFEGPGETYKDAYERVKADLNKVYHERNHLVSALSKLFPAGIARTSIPGWEAEWEWCVYIDLPTGQISYHFHDDEFFLFSHLPLYSNKWDGHDKNTVHDRLKALTY